MLPPVPTDVCEFRFQIDVGAWHSTFGFWVLVPGAGVAGISWAQAVIASWFINPQPSFLDCMHTDARFRTCRLSVGGPDGFQYFVDLADNAGAGTAGQSPSVAVGLYVQTLGGGRGSGSRIHLPGVRNEMTTDFFYLSDFGQQQLQFAAEALKSWVNSPIGPSGGPGVLGCVRRRTSRGALPVSSWDPAVDVRPTLMLENLSRRARSLRGLSP